MRKLKAHIRKNGFDYSLIERSDNVAIYAQMEGGRFIGFEVFEIKKLAAAVWKGRNYPAREKFPANSDFGKKAFSVRSLGRVLARAAALEALVMKRARMKGANYFKQII